MKHVLIDISGIFCQESFYSALKSGGLSASIVDLTDLEGTNCYCSEEAAEVIRAKVCALPVRSICWIDTGDYHYLSYFRGSSIREPFDLVLLDNHTDDFDMAGTLSCGNWVSLLQQEPTCRRSTLVRRREAADPVICESDVPVFLSIDLDVLRPEDFRTNWDQGSMTFEELLDILGSVAAARRIVAIDICGGITESKGATPSDLALNLRQRLRLTEYFRKLGV